ncbi:hypothetical protein GCM10028803_17350 [Larkinella knui]
MALYWGPDRICLYNDAYRGMLNDAARQPAALGQPAETVWAESWPLVKPLIDQAFSGSATWNEDQLIPRMRNGQLQNSYWTSSYSPVTGESGQPAGVLVTCLETTEQVAVRKKIELSETRQKLAIEAAGLGTFDWDMIKSEFVFSERLAAMFGYTESAHLVQSSFSDRVHPDDRQLRLEAHAEAVKTGRLFYEARFVWQDQSVHWIRLNGKILYDPRGVPSRMFGTTMDITEQKAQADWLEKQVAERTLTLQRKNEELSRSEERYHKMVNEVQDYAILLLDRDGTILNWNQGAERIKGYTGAEIIGKNFVIFYRPEDREKNLPGNLIREAFEKGRARHEGWRIRKDGSTFWGSIVITALHDQQGDIIGFSKVTRDLTEKKLAEDQLRQYAHELELQNKELEQFAYIASHDLQEPLRKIQTFSELLRENLDNAETADRYLSKIDTSAQRMSMLIKEVLKYSRLSKLSEEFVRVDLNEILSSVLVDFELLIEQKKAVVRTETLPVIDGIPLQLNQLFYNLLSNSLKFSEQSPHIQITSKILAGDELPTETGLKTSQTYAQLIFKDNGIGFDPQFARQIFTIFQRLNNRNRYSGTGIGLALCKKIVDNHQGAIYAESAANQGAAFFIYLPIARKGTDEPAG